MRFLTSIGRQYLVDFVSVSALLVSGHVFTLTNGPTALGFCAFLAFVPCPSIVFNFSYTTGSVHCQGVCIIRYDIFPGI